MSSASAPTFAARQAGPAYATQEAEWVMGDAVEQSVSRWMIVVAGAVAAAAMGGLLGVALSM